jgi:hypothetical protein
MLVAGDIGLGHAAVAAGYRTYYCTHRARADKLRGGKSTP